MENPKCVLRIKETPVVDIIFKGELRKLHNPQVGSIVSVLDNGFGCGINFPTVVILVKYNKEGNATMATLAAVTEIKIDGSNELVYYSNNHRDHLIIKPYHSRGYSRWDTAPSGTIHYLTFDKYVDKSIGYMK